MLYSIARPLIFGLDPERAHRLSIAALKARQILPTSKPPAGNLAINVAGIDFPNPVGMAAGYDKDGEVVDGVLGLGFGFAEIGSVTPLPQAGNPKPRLFRLHEDRAVINRMGFNNGGGQAAAKRLAARAHKGGVLGINIGANKDSADRVADYAYMTRLMAPLATYLTANISSPNTPGLRALQDESALIDLLDAIMEARGDAGPPVFLKVAPDLEPADIAAISRISIDKGLGALIVSNTTIARPALNSSHANETGGLSGAPLKDKALDILRAFRRETSGAIPLIGVGGIASADDAWVRIKAGASLVQIYSALVYEGPALARKIVSGLEAYMQREGYSTLAEVVGSA